MKNKLKVIFVKGVAGSGKTTELRKRTAELVKDYPKDEIQVVSFTREAAAHIGKELGVKSSTVHAMGYSLGGFSSGDVVSEDELKILDPDVIERESRKKARGEQSQGSYQSYLKERGKIDFNGMIDHKAVFHGLKVLIVDESQDMTPLQHKFISNIAKDLEVLVMAGDPNQCIYSFGEAVADFDDEVSSQLKRLGVDFISEEVILDKSYRVPEVIADFVRDKILTHVTKHSAIYGVGSGGFLKNKPSKIVTDFDVDVIIVRTNWQANAIAEQAIEAGFPVRRSKHALSVDSPQFFAWVNWDTYRAGVLEADEAEKIRRVLVVDAKDRESALGLEPRESYLYMKLERAHVKKDPVDVMTIHGVKGLEYDRVAFVCDFVGKSFADSKVEQARLCYVACTRAKKSLAVYTGSSKVLAPHRPRGYYSKR